MGFPVETPLIPEHQLKLIKKDRGFMDLALEQAGRLVYGSPTPIEGDSCRCPFHRDNHPSGSIHQVDSGPWAGDWLFTCHGCAEGRGAWNDLNPKRPTNSGDAMAVLCVASKRAGQEMGFPEACQWLLGEFTRRYGQLHLSGAGSPPPSLPSSPEPEKLAHARQEMTKAHGRLIENPELLDRLWEERAIDEDLVKRFGVGFSPDEPGGDYWVFPIHDNAGALVVVKFHADGDAQPKSWWYPKNAKRGNPLFPVDLGPADPVFVCPGELKGLAVISLGFAAVGITSGETSGRLPQEAIELLRSRSVAIVADADETGRTWADSVSEQLYSAGIDVRILDVGLAEGEDIGDWIVQQRVTEGRDVESVRTELVQAFEDASPFEIAATASVAPATAPATGDATVQPDNAPGDGITAAQGRHCRIRSIGEIWADRTTWAPVQRVRTYVKPLDDDLLGGLRRGALHLFVGKPGHAKTQTACQIAVNAAQHGTRVGFISLEMSEAELSRLVMAQLSGVPRRILDHGLRKLRNREPAQHVARALRQFHNLPLDIVDGQEFVNGFTRHDLQHKVTEGVERYGWELVCVDHLGEFAPLSNDPITQPLHADKANAAVLRAVARQHNIAMLVVAPLRKEANFKTPKKDKFALDDVMGSAALGYAVHTCIAVTAKYRPPANSEVHLHMLKNRNGRSPEKPIILRWEADCGHIFAAGSREIATNDAELCAPPGDTHAEENEETQ